MLPITSSKLKDRPGDYETKNGGPARCEEVACNRSRVIRSKGLKQLFQQGRFRIARSAFETALLMSLLDEDVIDCVTCHLNESHFYKTMPAEKVPGLMQDVYKIRYEGWRIYLKLQIDKDGNAVVISFKEDESSG